MSLLKRKISAVAAALTLLLSSGLGTINVFADSINQGGQITSNVINYSDIESANKKISNIIDKLEEYLDNKNIIDLDDKTIDDFFKYQLDESEKITGNEILSVVNESNKKTAYLKAKGSSDEEILNSQIIKSVIINNKIKIEVLSNGIFTVEEVGESIGKESRATQTSSARKDYKSWTGIHIFTVSAIGTFTYNGSKATFNNGTNNSYIKRGILSIWQVSDKSTSDGSRGTSAFAKISANLHYGIEINGVGLVVQDLYVMHEVLVDKSGKVTRTMTSR